MLNLNTNEQTEINTFCNAGLHLVAIEPIDGKPTKAPHGLGWNKPRSENNPKGYSDNAADFINCTGFNFGLYHSASNTLALDLDDLALAHKVFEDTTDFQLQAWLENDCRVEIKSPKSNRGKLLFKVPPGFNVGLKQLKHDGAVVFELRAGNCQDVIFGQHPEGGNYQFIGNPAKIPDAPAVLLDMLHHWDEWKPCLESALSPKPPVKIPEPYIQKVEPLSGRRDPIQEFNQSYGVSAVLVQAGYRQVGKDRFIRPGSTSKAPGVMLMNNCADGMERIYSHGGDDLNDSYAHDAFDCYKILECSGDSKTALNWNPEITLHNQKLFAQSKQSPALHVVKNEAKPDSAPVESSNSERFEIPVAPDKAGQKPAFKFISANDLMTRSIKHDWQIKSLFEHGNIGQIFGATGSGKSFVALDMGYCIAAGLDYCGLPTKQGSVVYICGEGFGGLTRRLQALQSKYGSDVTDKFFISEQPAAFMDIGITSDVAEAVKGLGNVNLVIIDTYHRNMGGGNENSADDFGTVLRNIDKFLKPLGVTVLLIHHSGHGDTDRSRGSSAIRAAMDFEYKSVLTGNSLTLSNTKMKDAGTPEPLSFDFVQTDLGIDDDGDSITSAYLDHKIGAATASSKGRKLSARDDAILQTLNDAITAHGVEPSADIKAKFGGFNSAFNPGRKVALVDRWRELAYKTITVDGPKKPDSLLKAFKRSREALANNGYIVSYGDYAWRLYEE